jgi:O-6-methylguanine DNA methyltransferase
MKLTPFAKKVYKVVLKIPLGQVRTYKWVAKRVGNPKAFRAVGQVLKNNPFPLIIPCHRVIKSNNDLGGYIFGKRIKKKILDIERQIKELML